jgi:hypothetical protein
LSVKSVVRLFDTSAMREALEQLTTDAAKLAARTLWSLPDSELIESLEAAYRLEQTAAAVKLHLVRQVEARGIPPAQRFRSTAAWLRSQLRLDHGPAREWVRNAALLDRRPVVDDALCRGAVDVRQAAAIAAAVTDLPPEAGNEATATAEMLLIRDAAEAAPQHLRRLGERILEQVAPEIAEQAERDRLDRADARAHAQRSFTLTMPEDGQVRVFGALSVADAAIVNAALDPLCMSRPGDQRTPRQRRADALVDICRLALRTTELPDNGGTPPQLAVTVPLDVVTGQLGTGTLDTGERLGPAAVRRLACDAQILPAVLGGAGQVLDAGRARRLASGPVRRALVVRDRGCAFPGCDRPPRWCDAHHLTAWTDGGTTALDNLVLLCRHHHRIVHDDHWQVRLGDDQLPDFIPPRWIDPRQRPRRNTYHPAATRC